MPRIVISWISLQYASAYGPLLFLSYQPRAVLVPKVNKMGAKRFQVNTLFSVLLGLATVWAVQMRPQSRGVGHTDSRTLLRKE
jgi:hypothetical protein